MADVNTAWLHNLKEQIDAIPDCRSLNKLIAFLRDKFNQLIEDLLNQISKLVGMIVPPTSLAKVIKYLKNLATQYLGPYLMAIRQLAQIIKAFAEILQAIQSKLANLHCSISSSDIISQLKTDLTSAAYRKLYGGNSTLSQLASIYTKLKSGIPPLNIIAQGFGVSIEALPTIANEYGGTLPFMSKMLDKYQPASIPAAPSIPTIVSPTDIPLEHPAPTIEEISTNIGSSHGGTTLVITGTGFLPDVTVTIGDVLCDNINLLDEYHIQCTTPALSTGFPYSIVVTNTDGQSVTLDQAFNVID
jgi:hypothetical protein